MRTTSCFVHTLGATLVCFASQQRHHSPKHCALWSSIPPTKCFALYALAIQSSFGYRRDCRIRREVF